MARRAFFLEVDEDRADDLIRALSQRPYISVVTATIEEKRKRKVCPCCRRSFPREIRYGFTDVLLEALLAVVYKMAVSKSVVIINKKTPADLLPPVELERAVEVDERILERALMLGAMKKFVDGSRDTYFVTAEAISFLFGESPFAPAERVFYEGMCVEEVGEITVDKVKFKDLVRQDVYLREVRRAIKELSAQTMSFVKSGQLSLVDL